MKNQTNQPQQIEQSATIDFAENANDINLISENSPGSWNFYNIRVTDNGSVIDFKIANILMFLENEGYRRLKMPNGGYELVKIEKSSILIFSDNADMVETIRIRLIDIDKQQEVWEEFLERNYLTTQLENAMERITEVKLNQATKTHSYFFFENGVV